MEPSRITQRAASFFHLNRNIQLVFVQSFFSSIGTGIMWGILPVFIVEITGSIVLLGLITTIAGVASTLILFPSGFLADYWRRDGLIIIGGFLAAIGTFLVVVANSFEALLFAQIIIGLSQGLFGSPIEALIADSTETGLRSKIYSQLYFVRMFFSAVGPFFGVFLAFLLGDYWGVEVLRSLLFFGAMIWFLGFISTLFMRDSRALGKESESENSRPTQYNENQVAQSSFKVPIIIVISGIIIGFGAGMTVQYFPLFFRDEIFPGYGLRPTQWYLILGTAQIVSGFVGIIAQRVSKRIGRVETMFSFQGIAVLALVMIIPNPIWGFIGTIFGVPAWAIIPPLLPVIFLFIFRNAFMNASNPLSRTIVMDKIAKRHRGKWNALEQLAWGFLWSFSAGIGGLIVEGWGYYACFTITATLYTIATLIILLIRKDVQKERDVVQNEDFTPEISLSTPKTSEQSTRLLDS
ncbi:MAG: MFS transporter [Promethearchaeota archaeon]